MGGAFLGVAILHKVEWETTWMGSLRTQWSNSKGPFCFGSLSYRLNSNWMQGRILPSWMEDFLICRPLKVINLPVMIGNGFAPRSSLGNNSPVS